MTRRPTPWSLVRRLVEDGQQIEVAVDTVMDELEFDEVFELAKSYLVDDARDHMRRIAREKEQRAENKMKAKRAKANREHRERENLELYGHKESPSLEEMSGVLEKALNDYAMTKHVEWTNELLASDFTLSNGETVTWGDATIEQHRDRCAMFAANVKSNADGHARHTLAIQELEASGLPTLNELVVQAAA